jgi:hypothetical protein
MLARHRRIRPWRALAYFLLALGGLIIWVDPFRQMEGVDPWVRWVWTGFLVVGGLGSMAGAITDRWRYEFAALPLLVAGFGGLVIVLCAGGGSTARLALACWLASIAVQTGRRWGGLWLFNRQLRRAKENGEQDA